MGTKCLLLRYLEPITAELDRGLALLDGDLPFHELCPPAPPLPCLLPITKVFEGADPLDVGCSLGFLYDSPITKMSLGS